MKVKVTKSKIYITEKYIVNRGEYKVNKIELEFDDEYEGLVKKVIFKDDKNAIEQAIINNEVDIPYEVLNSSEIELRIYAYELLNNNELKLRYSPEYTHIITREGSYIEPTGQGEVITPTQFEQYEQALNEGLAEVANVDIDANKIEHTATITITKRDGTEKQVQVEDGDDYVITQQDYEDIANIVKEGLSIPTKTSDLENDLGFVTNQTEDLTNYYTKTEVDTKISSVYRYRGTVATYADLPSTDLTIGDVYNVEEDGSNYAWNGTAWDKLGGEVDLSNYYNKTQTDTLLNGKLGVIIEITYADLKTLRDNSQLVKGQMYRITDYVTTTSQLYTNSAGHPFDILVQAISTNKLNNIAKAIAHAGNTYYDNRDLSLWELRYDLNNDTTKYDWANTSNGKGVIYYLKDEYNNECEYDHTNIRYKGSSLYDYTNFPEGSIDSNSYYYTFDDANSDYTTTGKVYNNKINCAEVIRSAKKELPIICFFVVNTGTGGYICDNIFENDSSIISIVDTSTSENYYIQQNKFNNAENSIIRAGRIENNIIKNLSALKLYSSGNNQVHDNIFESSNTITITAQGIYYNKFSNYSYTNTLNANGAVEHNVFDKGSSGNNITSASYSIQYNTFINESDNNSITAKGYIRYNKFDKGSYNTITIDVTANKNIEYLLYKNSERTSFNGTQNLKYLNIINVHGTVSNTFVMDSETLTTVTIDKYMQTDVTGNIICTWASDKDKITGIYKTGITDSTWKTITASYYEKPNTGIPKADLASDVQTSLGKADTAIQQHQDISGKQDVSNLTTSLSSSSTDTQYPSAKCVYDLVGDIESVLTALDVGNGVV